VSSHRSRRRRPRRPPATVTTTGQAHELAGDLLRELAPAAGDPEAVRVVLLNWLDRLDARAFATVCMATVFRTFGECLTQTPTDRVPPGSTAYTAPSTKEHEPG